MKAPHPTVVQAIERLDACVGALESVKDLLSEDLYIDLIAQSLNYAQHLSTSARFGVPMSNATIKHIGQEIALFCEFIENEFNKE